MGLNCVQDSDFFDDLQRVYRQTFPRPKILVINFPHNPTTAVVDLEFFKKIVAFAKEHNVIVIHDLAYADLVFDGYKAPSFLQVPGAKDVGVEFYTLSKAYNMPGWRVGFCCGNREVVGALGEDQELPRLWYFPASADRQRHCPQWPARLCQGDSAAVSKASRCVGERTQSHRVAGRASPWLPCSSGRRIPLPYRSLGSLEFSKLLLREAKVAVSPGIGFGEGGDEYVRFGLVENEHRTRQAVRGIRKALKLEGSEV